MKLGLIAVAIYAATLILRVVFSLFDAACAVKS